MAMDQVSSGAIDCRLIFSVEVEAAGGENRHPQQFVDISASPEIIAP